MINHDREGPKGEAEKNDDCQDEVGFHDGWDIELRIVGDASGESTIGAVAERERAVAGADTERRVIGDGGGDELMIFFRLDRARRVNNAATGFQARDGIFEDAALGVGDGIDVGGLESPADVDAAADDAGIGAGNIQENGIEGGMPMAGCWFEPIVAGGFSTAGMKPDEVFAQAWQAFFIGVGADERLRSAEGCGDEERLSAGSGAGIEHTLARLGCKQLNGVACGEILDVNRAGDQQLDWQVAFEFVKPGCTIDWLAGKGSCRGGRERIDAEIRFCRLVVPLHQRERFGFAKLAAPFVIQPIWV